MIVRKFRCRNCGERFDKEVFEKGEAERKQLPSGPVHCPKCNRTDVERDN